MDIKKHPKRIKDKYNPYTLQIKDDKYILSFVNGEGIRQKIEIDENLYQLFNAFELDDLSHIVEVSRHYEYSELTENALNKKALIQPEDLGELALKKLMIHQVVIAMDLLTKTQKKRIILYYIYGYTYLEIANMEKCTTSSVAKSITQGIKKIRRVINESEC